MEKRVAVTGPRGRVGSALVRELRDAGASVLEWARPDYDLDDSSAATRLVARDRPALVFHAAAWTDVEGCAREPDRAMRRNGSAAAELAEACVATGADLVYLSTNEIFDGERADGRGYAEDDPANPPNPYGRSKLNGEESLRAAYDGQPGRAWVVRTSWVFGLPGNDFPARITAAGDRLEGTARLRVVVDEIGRPTYAADLAKQMLSLIAVASPGTYHLANSGPASRFEWARVILARCRPTVELEEISLADYDRASVPPRWGVLDTTKAESLGLALRPWPEPLAAYLEEICPEL